MILTRIKQCVHALLLSALVVAVFCIIPVFIFSTIYKNMDNDTVVPRWSLFLPSIHPVWYTIATAIMALLYHKCIIIISNSPPTMIEKLTNNAGAYGFIYILAFIVLNVTMILYSIMMDVYDIIYFSIAFGVGVGGQLIVCGFILWAMSKVIRYVQNCYIMLTRKKEAEARKQDPQPTDFHHLMALVGVGNLYSFLEPKDLLSFSLTNHRTYDEINSNLMKVVSQQMPREMSYNRIGDIGRPEREDFTTTLSLSSQLTHNCPARLFEHLALKLERNNILAKGGVTKQEELVALLNEKGRVDLQLPTDASDKARETYEKFLAVNPWSSPLRISAHFKQGLTEQKKLFGKRINPRDTAKKMLKNRLHLSWFRDQEEYKLVHDWLYYILSNEDVAKTIFVWGWSLLQPGILSEKVEVFLEDAIIAEDHRGRVLEVKVTEKCLQPQRKIS